MGGNNNLGSFFYNKKIVCTLLALRVTLIIQENKPSTHQNVCGGRFMNGGQMDKTQYKNDLTQKLDKQCIGK
jgi:hypothetical protein